MELAAKLALDLQGISEPSEDAQATQAIMLTLSKAMIAEKQLPREQRSTSKS